MVSEFNYQNAIFQISSWTPMEHSSWIVFHFGFFKIEIFWLIVSDAGWHWYTITLLGTGSAASTRRPSYIQKKYVHITIPCITTNCRMAKDQKLEQPLANTTNSINHLNYTEKKITCVWMNRTENNAANGTQQSKLNGRNRAICIFIKCVQIKWKRSMCESMTFHFERER